MLYEIINPSDPCTFMSDDVVAAGVVVILLGSGQYSAKVIDEQVEDHPGNIPFFMFGGFEDWVKEKTAGQSTPETVVKDYASLVVAALRTVCYGSATQRRLYDLALQSISDKVAKSAFIEKWNDETRTSLNDIMGRAHALAEKLEKKYILAKT